MPKGKTTAPIAEWSNTTGRQPTTGGTPPSQLFCIWHQDHHVKAQLALKRAQAAVPKMVPALSVDEKEEEFDDFL